MPLTGEYAEEKTEWVRDQLAKIDEAGTTEVVGVQGMAVVVYTVRSAKTGKLRRVPLMRVEHDGVYAAVASYGGAPKHPAWYYNFVANPQVEVMDGTSHHDGVARRIEGDERAQWWERAVAAYPPYAEYQTKTDREIPVFVVEPA
ncbi:MULTISPECIES: nitroreductase family deazaflavin-dependent oxidoreductase [Allobranchiibius]|uniref:Deazaflavin-dependent oxidoreductase (Nitroreductase family) n=1 Tax=Allobranchiibius huperziae TaxID=1874116 RepID=A0A853DFS9_9MICO|nr:MULTISPECIES: nitroreductase family deazaflavin-dependent oxidoreductase [Allobranchiibius]NYJ74829.1 deazaflavin-dependent oxidoreductase (nitroreductase family) [Allobranchiibius huperziae]UIJ33807.1 nitroreductase family deazaflavin-dependent oxidoreductase [Allobranchiibius sp. GilTou73]